MLTKKDHQILKLLGAGNPVSVVARVVGCSRSSVSCWKDKFVSIGAIRLQVRDVVHIYRLTRYGSKILAMSEGCFPEVCVLDDHAVKFRVLEWKRLPIEWKRLGRPRNFEKLGVRIGNVWFAGKRLIRKLRRDFAAANGVEEESR